jgi:hypothetical protein
MAFQILDADNLVAAQVSTPILNPAEAEVRFTFELCEEIATPELRGRLMGPRSAYASTVEIAYPFRPLPRSESASPTTITGRAIIPEPSFWEPASPFLYQGPIELWAGGQPRVRLQVSHGLCALRVGAAGVYWNGTPVRIKGRRVDQANAAQALDWRQAGFNAWLIDDGKSADELCELADRHGFFVFVRVSALSDMPRLAALGEHACCLGWIIPQSILQPRGVVGWRSALVASGRQLVGVAVENPRELGETAGISFLCLDAEMDGDRAISLPRLVVADRPPEHDSEDRLGYILR